MLGEHLNFIPWASSAYFLSGSQDGRSPLCAFMVYARQITGIWLIRTFSCPYRRLWKYCKTGTHADERTVLFKTISLDGIKPHTNPNPKLTLMLILFSCFMLFSSTVLWSSVLPLYTVSVTTHWVKHDTHYLHRQEMFPAMFVTFPIKNHHSDSNH